jgi:hypothetical protein
MGENAQKRSPPFADSVYVILIVPTTKLSRAIS